MLSAFTANYLIFVGSYSDEYGVARLLPDLIADILADPDNIADGTVAVLHAHIYNASGIRLAVEGDLCLDPAFAEFFADVIWETYICAAFVGNRLYDGMEFIYFRVCKIICVNHHRLFDTSIFI